MLTGENLPDYETLARHLVYTATGQAPDKIRKTKGKDEFLLRNQRPALLSDIRTGPCLPA